MKKLPLIMVLLFLSCSNQNQIKEIEQILDLKIQRYSIVRNDDSYGGIGDDCEVIEIKVNKSEFEILLKKIRNIDTYSKTGNTLYKNFGNVEKNRVYFNKYSKLYYNIFLFR